MLQYIALGSAVIAFYCIWSWTNFYFRERKFRKSHGTQKPKFLPTVLPFGVDYVTMSIKQLARQEIVEFYRGNFEEYGHTFGLRLFGATTLFTREPLNVKAMLATQFEDYLVAPPKHGPFDPLLGGSVFTQDGPGWVFYRGLLRPQFSREQITQLENLEEHISDLFACIPTDGTSINLQEFFFDLTLDSGTHFLFGESAGALKNRLSILQGKSPSDEEPPGVAFARALNTSQNHILIRYCLKKFYNWHNPKEFQEANKTCHTYIDKYVQQAINIHDNQNKQGDEAKLRKEKYVLLHALAKVTKDPDILRGSLLGFLLAGRDTTAGLLGFTLLLLVRYPNVEQKLRQSIYSSFGPEYDENRITFESLKSCRYLRWVLDETLRLYPSAPINIRVAARDTTLPVGGGPDGKSPIFVPKGTEVEYSVYAMHRRLDIFGPDPNWFRPERFDEFRAKEDIAWSYLPFNGGPRICIGQQFALTEAAYVVVRLFQQFKQFESGENNQFIKCYTGLTTCVGGNGVRVKCFRN